MPALMGIRARTLLAVERAVAEARAFGSEHDRDAVCVDLVEQRAHRSGDRATRVKPSSSSRDRRTG